jgi:hypothetical protein
MRRTRERLHIATTIIVMVMAASSSSLPVDASTISLFNTGVDSSGTPLAGGTFDPHWSIISGPGITTPVEAVVLTNQHPHGNYVSSPNSQWVWANASGDAGINSPYTLQLTFDLSGFNPGAATLSGFWAADNFGSILLNGSSPIGTGTFDLPGDSSSNFNSFHAFTITGGFTAGINTLDFVITDDGNPGGLNVTNLVATASVPEPSSLVLLFGGFGVVLLLRAKQQLRLRPGLLPKNRPV